MRTQKIRGHKRIWKRIDNWVANYKNLDIDQLKVNEREYAKIRVRPYSNLSMLNSKIPSPKGETKRKILKGLIEIYLEWKSRLDKLNEPYYLKIWLFEPNFEKSQVVCSIGGMIDFYQQTFFKPEELKMFPYKTDNLSDLELNKFKWEYRLDEMHLTNNQVGDPEEYASQKDYLEYNKWFNQKLKKPHRTTIFKEVYGGATESYSFKVGGVWLGYI